MTPRVLIVAPQFAPAWSHGGGVRAIWSIALGLQRAGARVRVVTTNAFMQGAAAARRSRTEQGVEIEALPVIRAGGTWAERHGIARGLLGALRSAVRNADRCVLQGLWTLPCTIASRLCQAHELRYVLSANGTLQELSLAEKRIKKLVFRRLVADTTVRRASAVVFASELERATSLRALGATPGIVLPNSFEAPPLATPRPEAIRERVGAPPGTPLLGLSGRIHPRKGFDIAVLALAGARTPARLVLFGSDEEGQGRELRALATRVGVGDRVHYLGDLDGDELQTAYASLDLLLLPSHGESFGNVVIEALLQGTEVLASDRVALADYVGQHGFGRVVASLDPREWAAAIDARLSDPGRLDRARVSGRVARDFDVEAIGRRWLDELAGL